MHTSAYLPMIVSPDCVYVAIQSCDYSVSPSASHAATGPNHVQGDLLC